MWQYHYGSGSVCAQAQALVRVVLNTVEAQYHHCKRIPPMIVMPHHLKPRGLLTNDFVLSLLSIAVHLLESNIISKNLRGRYT